MRNKKTTILTIAVLFMLISVGAYSTLGATLNKNIIPLPTTSGELTVHFIDVEQGDCILIETPELNYILIDTGSRKYSDRVIDYLHDVGVSVIHTFVATHPHEDHIGGCKEIFDEFDIYTVYHPGYYSSTATYQRFLDAAESEGCTIYTDGEVDPGDYMYISDYFSCQILSINKDAPNANEASIVMRLDYNDVSFLFTGDIEEDVEEYIVDYWDVDIDILKVAHHGSRYASTDYFLYEATPTISVISVGEVNDYGHPTPEALARLTEHGSEIYRTDLNGNIKIETDGNNWNIYYDESESNPFTPTLEGSTYVEPGESYTYIAISTDPEEDELYYMWDWSDGYGEEILGPYNSGDPCMNSYEWDAGGPYTVKVKAIDCWGYESGWALLHVNTPRKKLIVRNNVEDILENLQNLFPMLSNLLGRL